MRHAACIITALILSSACQPATIVVPLPGDPAARALIVAAEATKAFVIDLDAQAEAHFALLPSDTSQADLEAWAYSAPAADLRLVPGPLPRDLEAGVPLPVGARAYRYGLLGPHAPRWESVEPSATALSAFRARIPHCYGLRVESALLDSPEAGVVAAIAMPPERVLVATTLADLYVVTSTGATRLSKVGARDFYATGGTAIGDEKLVLGEEKGAIAIATLEGPSITIERVGTSVSSPRYLAAGRDGAASEVFVITRGYLQGDATFGRFFEGRWTHLTAFPDDISETAAGGVAWLGPGRAIAGLASSPRLWRYDGGILSDEGLGSSAEGISALAYVDGLGEVVGTLAGTVFLRQNGAWRSVPGFALNGAISAVAAFEDGFWFAYVSGRFGYYKPDHGVCLAGPGIPNSPTAIVAAGEAWIFAGSRSFGIGVPQVGRVYVDR